uniref:Uncharacterized protein LOC105128430 n=1 Tax=Rhizophora mucronata TaxID=61149 RepID=A0A2P2K5W0_RHIMU
MAAAVAVSYYKPSPFLGQFLSHFGKPASKQNNSNGGSGGAVKGQPCGCKVSALFWGSRNSNSLEEAAAAAAHQMDYSLQDDSTLTGISGNQMIPRKISISVVSSISEVSSSDWDACNLDATGPQKFNPFLTHAFLSSLELSRSAVKVSSPSVHYHWQWN